MRKISSIDNQELLSEYPEFVYYNLPIELAPLVITFPNKQIDIPENPSTEHQQDEISIKMRNNKVWRQIPKLNNKKIYDSISPFLPTDIKNIFDQINEDTYNEIERYSFIKFIIELSSIYDKKNSHLVEHMINNALAEEGELSVDNYHGQMEIDGVYYKSKYYPFDKIQEELRPQIEELMKPCEVLSHVKLGDYLYRAIDKAEWEQILRDKSYCVRTKTNFEDSIGSQVVQYSKTDGYAGKVIRIKVEGQWFKDAGFQVPRVESISAFYANVEVLEGNQWFSIDKYLD